MSRGPHPDQLTGLPTFVAQGDVDHLRARLTHVLEYMTDGFAILDPDWRFVYANRAAVRLLQRPVQTLLGQVVWELFPEAIDTRFYVEYHKVMETGEPACFDAEYAPLDVCFSVRVHRCNEGIEVYFLDIKEQFRAHARIQEQASLLDQARDALIVRTLDNVVTYWNQAAARLYGWSAEEAVGRTTLELMNSESDEISSVNQSLLEHGVWSGELRQVSRSGARLLIKSSHTLVRDAAGQPSRVFCINTDVTEERRLLADLMRAQRMESLATLAGGLAHELNNTLAPVVMGLDALKDEPCASAIGDDLDVIAHGASRAAEMVAQVLAFSRGLAGEHDRVDLSEVVASVGIMMRDSMPRSVAVTTAICPNLWAVLGDASQCRQALLNLCLNARDAMPDGGDLRLSADNVTLDAEAAAAKGLAAGSYVQLAVADTGSGISPAIIDRIFEPFFSGAGVGERTGLGLAMVHAIVRSHGGAVAVDSKIGVGSTFRIYLPVARA